jgi:hypothetical protein
MVAFLAHAVRERRILLVGTYRSEEVRAGNPVRRLDAETLVLEPLTPGDIDALVVARSETPVPAEFRRMIAVRSEGNPLFARELLAAAARGETAVPEALRDLLLGYVARLGPDARSVLRVAAAAGRDASYGLLAAVVSLDELELAGALREAVEQEVLVPEQAGGTFRFRHALFAEAVYGTLLPGEREVLHERLARALTEEPRLATNGAAAGEVAHHWVAARRPAEAFAASLQAAREAQRVSGLAEALRHVERVLRLWDQVPAAEEVSGVALPSLLAWAGELARDDHALSAPPDLAEARRLYPTAVVLESLAVQQTGSFDQGALDALRAANERLRAAAGDPAAASAADDAFHRALTAPCGNAPLLAALEPVKQALLRYEQIYMGEPTRVERSVAQHDAIIEALERGDHAGAAQLLRENLGRGLPDLRAELEP